VLLGDPTNDGCRSFVQGHDARRPPTRDRHVDPEPHLGGGRRLGAAIQQYRADRHVTQNSAARPG